MAFKLKPNPTFKATAEISVPGEGAEPLRIPFEFRHLSRSAYKAEIEDAGLTVYDAVLHVTVGWEVEEVPFSRERLTELMDDFQAAPGEIFELYVKESRASKRKN
jgi:hypothetical protein